MIFWFQSFHHNKILLANEKVGYHHSSIKFHLIFNLLNLIIQKNQSLKLLKCYVPHLKYSHNFQRNSFIKMYKSWETNYWSLKQNKYLSVYSLGIIHPIGVEIKCGSSTPLCPTEIVLLNWLQRQLKMLLDLFLVNYLKDSLFQNIHQITMKKWNVCNLVSVLIKFNHKE